MVYFAKEWRDFLFGYVKANLHAPINRKRVSGRKSAGFTKIYDFATDFFESGRFSARAILTGKEIGRQIITCKLAHAIEPPDRTDKSVGVN